MKTSKLLLSIIILFLAFNFISCNNEPIDSKISLKTNEVIPTDPSNPPIVPIIANPSGDFYPFKVNNIWNFNNGTLIKDNKITATQTINTKEYYKLNRSFFKAYGTFNETETSIFFRKEAGIYHQRVFVNKPEVFTPQTGLGTPASPFVAANSTSTGIVIQPYEFIFLKESLPIGESFLQSIPLSILSTTTTSVLVNSVLTQQTNNVNSVQNLEYKITTVEKIPVFVVNGYSTSVIKTKVEIVGVSGYQYNWYAKDIGLIKQANVNGLDVVTSYWDMTTFTLL
jgi:hypothetical protein